MLFGVLEKAINRLLFKQGDTDEMLELKRTFFVFAYLLVIPPVIFLTALTYILEVPVLQLYGHLLLSYYALTMGLFLWLKNYVFRFYYLNSLVVMSITFYIAIKQGGLLHTGGILYSMLAIIIFSFVFENLKVAVVTSVYYVAGIVLISIMQQWLTPAPEMLRGNNNLIFTTINSLWISLFILAMVYYVFEKRTRETKIKNDIIAESLDRLKTTQAQLIQAGKMAALGELTAGIAHEIQNPLNFVNNFTELNRELIAELREEVKKGNLIEISAIVNDIDANDEKILLHGRRADSIVKSMLEHSRAGSGVKEPTDLNALCDEYFRLAYHGMRAKDKSFKAELVTVFDPAIGKLNIIPQDFGRVILNLINNAFYAVSEKQKIAGEGYQPAVELSTRKEAEKIEIRVKDNGTGIPEMAREKIFQPFFTTKPTGRGTGLGLSLSYDIVKAHGGEIGVESEEGGGAVITIILPALHKMKS